MKREQHVWSISDQGARGGGKWEISRKGTRPSSWLIWLGTSIAEYPLSRAEMKAEPRTTLFPRTSQSSGGKVIL